MKQNKIIGIAGSIASGKSTVGKILRDMGCVVIDADEIARDVVTKDSEGYQRIVQHFPEVIDGGVIDRKRLAEEIFRDAHKRELLNGLLHPLILEESRKRFATHQDLVFFEAPLLFESEILHDMDMTIYVTARKDLQIKRLMERDGIDESYAVQKLEAFKKPEVTPSIILYNNGSLQDLRHSVAMLLVQLRRHAHSGAQGTL